MTRAANLFRRGPSARRAERFETLVRAGRFRIERIVSRGQRTPPGRWLKSRDAEWVLVLEGAATLSFVKKPPVRLEPGDYYLIPSGCAHRVERTRPRARTVWLAVHFKK